LRPCNSTHYCIPVVQFAISGAAICIIIVITPSPCVLNFPKLSICYLRYWGAISVSRYIQVVVFAKFVPIVTLAKGAKYFLLKQKFDLVN
jgi:hypothetical protein